MNNQELEERLIDFAVQIVTITEKIPDSLSARHLCKQLLRSGTSPVTSLRDETPAGRRVATHISSLQDEDQYVQEI